MRDPVQYARFSDERSRPFFNLLERVPQRPFERIVDLGCGAGELTVELAQRWSEAKVVGLDNSPQMLAKSGQYALPGRLEFVEQVMPDQAHTPAMVSTRPVPNWPEIPRQPLLDALTARGCDWIRSDKMADDTTGRFTPGAGELFVDLEVPR